MDTKKPLTWQDIDSSSPFPTQRYSINVPVAHLERNLDMFRETGLDMDPDFQRAHVWTEAQQIAFVEYFFLGGASGRVLYFASKGWSQGGEYNTTYLVDGKQRLEAMRKFNRDELPIFGGYTKRHIGGMQRMLNHSQGFVFSVADVDRVTMLRWYLALNGGGTPHTKTELDKVRALLEAEENEV